MPEQTTDPKRSRRGTFWLSLRCQGWRKRAFRLLAASTLLSCGFAALREPHATGNSCDLTHSAPDAMSEGIERLELNECVFGASTERGWYAKRFGTVGGRF